VIITLALGMGANAAIFTLVRGVLIKPAHASHDGTLREFFAAAPKTAGEAPALPFKNSPNEL
jgi:hypothetical protein